MLTCRELSRQDKLALLRLGVGKHLLDPETEAKLMASEPRLDLEIDDPFKASTLTFKFVAVKTTFSKAAALPAKMYFTFKFYTFKTEQTKTVVLKNEAAGGQLKTGTQYFLEMAEEGRGIAAEKTLSYNYDVDQSLN